MHSAPVLCVCGSTQTCHRAGRRSGISLSRRHGAHLSIPTVTTTGQSTADSTMQYTASKARWNNAPHNIKVRTCIMHLSLLRSLTVSRRTTAGVQTNYENFLMRWIYRSERLQYIEQNHQHLALFGPYERIRTVDADLQPSSYQYLCSRQCSQKTTLAVSVVSFRAWRVPSANQQPEWQTCMKESSQRDVFTRAPKRGLHT